MKVETDPWQSHVDHGWVRWIWENFLWFHWPAGQMVDCCSLSVVGVPGEHFLREILMHPHMHGSCSSLGNQCSQADFISCPFYSQPPFPLAHTAPYISLLPKGHNHPTSPLIHFALSSAGTFHKIPVQFHSLQQLCCAAAAGRAAPQSHTLAASSCSHEWFLRSKTLGFVWD